MKIPGAGEVKNKNVLIGGSIGGVLVIWIYLRRKKANAAAAANSSAAGGQDPNAIDPATGIPYGEETGYGGYYMGASVPNPYVSAAGTPTVSGQTYTSNLAWTSDAVQYGSAYFNASPVLVGDAVGKYLSQDRAGLNTDEYTLMSEIIGLIGQPPNGNFRLIAAAPIQNPSSPPGGTGGGGSGSVPAQDPNLHYLSDGTISLNTLARYNHSTPVKIIGATITSEPGAVGQYMSKGNYNAILPRGTKWNIPRNA